MKKIITLITSLVIVGSVLLFTDFKDNSSYSYSSGYTGYSSAPGDGTCDACHGGYAVTPETGWITSNIPASGYTGGQTYTITCTATYSSSPRFGFNCAAKLGTGSTATSTNAGTFTAGTGSQTSGGEITHTSSGTSGSGSKSWSFSWTAPAAGSGVVTFYSSFNCSNGNGSTSGDHIMTSTLVVQEASAASDDAGISAVVTPSGTVCSSAFVPVVTLKNYGTTTLTSVTIQYKIDNGTAQTKNWTGSLASGATTNVTLASMNGTSGSHTFTATTSSPNGNSDGNTANDSKSSSFTSSTTATSLPYAQGFESTSLPSGWTTSNNPTTVAMYGWKDTTVAKTGSYSVYVDNANDPGNGDTHTMVTTPFDISGATNMTFDLSYKLWTDPTTSPNYSDTLIIYISTDCGATYTQIYKKYGTALTTTTPTWQNSAYAPASSADWRTETISLSSYSSYSTALFKFVDAGDYENNLYIDNLNINGNNSTTGINNLVNNNDLNIYPNPVSDVLTVKYLLAQDEHVSMKLYSIEGKEIANLLSASQSAGEHTQHFDFNNKYASGIYFLRVTTGNNVSVHKVIVK